MKAPKKALAADIALTVESKLSDVGDQSQKIKKLVRESAKKLATKVIKLRKKEEKKKPKSPTASKPATVEG